MPVIMSGHLNKRVDFFVRKFIVFFNGNAPYLVEVGEHLDSLRLEYPDQTQVNLPIQSHMYPGRDIMEVCFFVSDRNVTDRDIHHAIDTFL